MIPLLTTHTLSKNSAYERLRYHTCPLDNHGPCKVADLKIDFSTASISLAFSSDGQIQWQKLLVTSHDVQ